MMKEVNVIYDQLFEFESTKRDSYYPIHKKLNLENKQDDLIDWILANVPFNPGESVLDVGCGTGYTLFRLAKEKKVTGKGISISGKEILFANRQLKKEPQSLKITFSKCSFDHPFKHIYDKIIAIESLKHSEDIYLSVKNLCNAISTNGTMIIADDFIRKNSTLIEWHKKLWNARSFINLAQFEEILNKVGLFKIERHDFTRKVKTRSTFLLAILIPLTYLAKWLSVKKRQTKIEIFLGGLLLEFLYKKKKVSYYLITATKIS